MHHPGVAGMELDAADVAGAADRQRHGEDAEDIALLARQGVAGGQRDDEIGSAEVPPIRPARQRGRRPRSFNRIARPPADQLDPFRGQPRLSNELAGMAVGLPRRHEAAGGDGGNLRRPPAGVVEGQQVEGPGAARPVALGAVAVQQRRDILVEGRRRGARRGRWLGDGGPGQRGDDGGGPRQGQPASPEGEALGGHGRCRTMVQPTAGTAARDTGAPASTAVTASARSWVVGATQSTPKST